MSCCRSPADIPSECMYLKLVHFPARGAGPDKIKNAIYLGAIDTAQGIEIKYSSLNPFHH